MACWLLSKAQYEALGTVALSADNTITVTMTAGDFGNLAAIGDLADDNVDFISISGDGVLALTKAQYDDLGTVAFTAASIVLTLTLTAGDLVGLDATAITALGTTGVDVLNVSGDGVLALSKAQYEALGEWTSADNTITVVMTAGDFGNLAAIGALADDNVDLIDISGDHMLALTKAQFDDLGTVAFTAASIVTLTLTAGDLVGLDATAITALGTTGVDALNVSGDGVLVLSKEQYEALGTFALSADNTITVVMTAGDFGNLAAIGALADDNVDFISIAGDGVLALTKAQFDALGSGRLHGSEHRHAHTDEGPTCGSHSGRDHREGR